MCYAIPAKLIAIKDNQIGVIDYFGEKRNILIDLDNVHVGDYVYAQGGVMVSKVSEEEALSILDTWKDIFFELKRTDEALSKIDTDALPPNVLSVLQQVNLRKTLKKEEMMALYGLQGKNELSVLYEVANNVRQREHGNASCVHGIIEFSNYCDQACCYCGVRKNRDIPRYRLSADEIIRVAKNAVDRYGFKALVLQSGEDHWYDTEKLTHIVKTIRKMGVLVFLSIGSREPELYQALYDAGARAALIRFETSNEALFQKFRPGTTLQERIELIQAIKEMGYVLATGFLLGLPGEAEQDCVNNILLTKYLDPDMYSFGPLIPTADTPLANVAKVEKELILKTIAITRFVASNSNILVTTALETLDAGAKKEALMAGANSLMINITPEQYKKMYTIYDDRSGIDQTIADSIENAVRLLHSLGRAPTDLGVH